MSNYYKWGFAFALFHLVLILPHILGLAYISIHEGTIYSVLMTFIEAPGILVVNILGLETETLIFVINTLFFALIGVLFGVLLKYFRCRTKSV